MRLLLLLACCCCCPLLGGAAAAANGTAAGSWWRPTPGLRFDYMLATGFDPARHIIPGVQVYLVDGFETTAASVATAKAQGLSLVCYFSAGSREDWRPDAGDYPAADIGSPLQGWRGENWVNVRSPAVRAIAARRLQMCRDKGFIAADPDNVDGYKNANGLGLTDVDQLSFNKWLAAEAHGLGLAVGLKNDLDQIPDLVDDFDFFVNEQCAEAEECDAYAPAVAAGKPVWSVEYQRAAFEDACAADGIERNITTILKNLGLDAALREECPGTNSSSNATGGARGGAEGLFSAPLVLRLLPWLTSLAMAAVASGIV